jgi:glycerophosphoryl diester phosphodiesterase
MARTRFAAHRGGAALWPENSLLAFREAIALGAPLVELDVHLAADGGLVVIHDRTLERTTEGAGPVGDLPAAEVSRLRLKGPDGRLTEERVPMLEEVLGLLAPSPADLLVEVKGPGVSVLYERVNGGVRAMPGPGYEGLEARLLAALEASGMAARATVLAFNPDVLACVHALVPAQRTALLVSRGHVDMARAQPAEAVDWAVAAGATDVGLEHTLVGEGVVKAARQAGLALGVWTVNDEAAIRRFADLGVDIVTTDRPGVAQRVLGTS